MNAIHQLSHLSGWLWANIADHLWQSAVLVVIAASLRRPPAAAPRGSGTASGWLRQPSSRFHRLRWQCCSYRFALLVVRT